MQQPRLLVFTTVFPNPGQPGLGQFVRERMFHVGRKLPLVVVAPVPWFPFQALLRLWKPHFRPPAPILETNQGFTVYHPRFFSVPGVCKALDGVFLALSTWPLLRRLQREFSFNVIDAHFAYPDGFAATLLGRWLGVPVTITLRGTEVPISRFPWRRRMLVEALQRAHRVFSVADALRRHVATLGVDPNRIRVVGNGVDTAKFFPVAQAEARQKLELPLDSEVLVTVGGLAPRKGFHRVIDCLPALLAKHPRLQYLVVGGPSPEGDLSEALKAQAERLGVADRVRFLGPLPHDRLRIPLSAADVFVLSTSNEGWANVLLEAMACGLPVVTTDVGGNGEVVCEPSLGIVVPFGDPNALTEALDTALTRFWDKHAIVAYAQRNSWDDRSQTLIGEFESIVHSQSSKAGTSNIRQRRSDGKFS